MENLEKEKFYYEIEKEKTDVEFGSAKELIEKGIFAPEEVIDKMLSIVKEHSGLGFRRPQIYYDMLEKDQIRLLVKDKEIVGFLTFLHYKKDREGKKVTKLDQIGLASRFIGKRMNTGQTFGEVLLNEFIQECKNLGRSVIQTKVKKDNQRMQNFLERKFNAKYIGDIRGKKENYKLYEISLDK